MNRPCPECQAIYAELRESWRKIKELHADRLPPVPALADWLRTLDGEECARMRETSDLWKTWRKMREHCALTGHAPILSALPPGALSNPN